MTDLTPPEVFDDELIKITVRSIEESLNKKNVPKEISESFIKGFRDNIGGELVKHWKTIEKKYGLLESGTDHGELEKIVKTAFMLGAAAGGIWALEAYEETLKKLKKFPYP